MEYATEPPDCGACGKVEILESNYDVFTLIEKYSFLIWYPDGGINPQGLEYAMKLHGVHYTKKDGYIQKIAAYLYKYNETVRKKRENMTKIK